MKNFFASICFFIVLFTTKQASAQTCTPQAATGTPGVNPPTQNLGCVERGQPYNDVIYIENFNQFNTTLGTATLNYLRIDSITNLPCDLQWKSNKQDNTYLAAETGCISLFGTSNDNVGQYRVKIYITVEVVVPGFPQPLVLADEAEALVNQVEALSGTPTGINFKYYLRVIELGEPCPALDTTANATNNVACSVIVNPVLGVTVTATDDTICTGETTQLTAIGNNGTPPYTYKWLSNSSLSDTTIANPIASPTETTEYTAIVTDANGDASFTTKTIVVDCTVDIGEQKKNSFNMFPNPASSYFTISFESAISTVQIFNTNATLLLEEKYFTDANNHNTKTLYLSNFSKGIYFVKVISKQGVALKKLIIE